MKNIIHEHVFFVLIDMHMFSTFPQARDNKILSSYRLDGFDKSLPGHSYLQILWYFANTTHKGVFEIIDLKPENFLVKWCSCLVGMP